VRWDGGSLLEESSLECAAEEQSADDPKMSELQSSLARLSGFVERLDKEGACSVPASVKEYCDKL
jgi:hypothetical protein